MKSLCVGCGFGAGGGLGRCFNGFLRPYVETAAGDENRAGVLPGQEKTSRAPDGHVAIEALQFAEALANTAGQRGRRD